MRVELDGVSVDLGGVRVLDDVSATIEPGTLVGLVGPNGAGKTTLLRTINAYLVPTEGTVRIGGDRIHDLGSRDASRRVATVPQKTTLSFDFSVREVVEMGRHPHRERFGREDDETPVEDALERAQVREFADRSITEVSGGERQRVLLARALAQDAPVFLFDEPTASLDINHQVRTLELVCDLAGEGRTVIAAIHDLDLAARFCDEIALIYDGAIRAHGPPDRVFVPDVLEETFETPIEVGPNPVTGTPSITALGDDARSTVRGSPTDE